MHHLNIPHFIPLCSTMKKSKKSISSSSTPISEEKHEAPLPSPLPHQLPITNLVSFNFPSFTQISTFSCPITLEVARYWINSDGYIFSDGVGLSARNQIFREKPVILEISNGLNIINCITQFAQRYGVSVTVLCGDGLISDVDFMYPHSTIVPMHMYGCYQMISFSGTYNYINATYYGDVVRCFNVSLIEGDRNIIGGLVASTLKAASNVTIVVVITNDLS